MDVSHLHNGSLVQRLHLVSLAKIWLIEHLRATSAEFEPARVGPLRWGGRAQTPASDVIRMATDERGEDSAARLLATGQGGGWGWGYGIVPWSKGEVGTRIEPWVKDGDEVVVRYSVRLGWAEGRPGVGRGRSSLRCEGGPSLTNRRNVALAWAVDCASAICFRPARSSASSNATISVTDSAMEGIGASPFSSPPSPFPPPSSSTSSSPPAALLKLFAP